MRVFEGYQRGVNLGGWLSQNHSMEDAHFASFITRDDIARIAGWGLDHIRLPVDCDVVFADHQGTPHARMRHVDDCIAWCAEFGLRVVLDLHKTFGFMFDQDVVPDPDAFFTDEGLQDAFIAIWETFARRYGDRPGLIAFELLNEVTNPEFTRPWNRIADRAIRSIRAIAPETWILVGGVYNNSVSSVPTLDPPRDARIVYNFHCYEPLVFTHQKAPWVRGMPADFAIAYPETLGAYRRAARDLGLWQADAAPDDGDLIGPAWFRQLFAAAIDYAGRMDAPLYCGEYGVIDRVAPEDALRWFRDIHTAFDECGIGRAAWSYKQMDFGLSDARMDGVRGELVKVL